MSKFRVIASSLNVRSGPGKSYPVTGVLPKNKDVSPTDQSLDERWVFIKLIMDGKSIEGWIYKDYLVPVDAIPSGTKPEWLKIAEAEIGVKEKPGEADHPRIIEYHTTTTLGAKDDAVAWCSSFVNWCVEQAGEKGTKSAAAVSWMDWGKKLDSPTFGCIVVLRRGPNPAKGHVGFYAGDASGGIRLLGGNQSDQVKVSVFPKSMVRSYRWVNQ